MLLGADLHVVEPAAAHGRIDDRPNLSGLYERVERYHRLFDRAEAVEAVDLVEIQALGAEALER